MPNTKPQQIAASDDKGTIDPVKPPKPKRVPKSGITVQRLDSPVKP